MVFVRDVDAFGSMERGVAGWPEGEMFHVPSSKAEIEYGVFKNAGFVWVSLT